MTGDTSDLPVSEADIRDMIRKLLPIATGGGAEGGAALNTLVFLQAELMRVGRGEVYDEEYRRWKWASLGIGQGLPEADQPT